MYRVGGFIVITSSLILNVLISQYCCQVFAFTLHPSFVNLSNRHKHSIRLITKLDSGSKDKNGENSLSNEYIKEAERLQELAKSIRESIPDDRRELDTAIKDIDLNVGKDEKSSVDKDILETVDYRMYVDIGREPGTWMDPRWGASGKRIEFTLDIQFCVNSEATDIDICTRMNVVKGGVINNLKTSDTARLRGGFDKMNSSGGAYRFDNSGKSSGRISQSTLRFFIDVDGTPQTGSTYGDISIPKGCLYFAIPCFGNSLKQISSKDGTVTVRQIGWNTGWRRQESRIVGTFRMLPLEKAKQRDKF